MYEGLTAKQRESIIVNQVISFCGPDLADQDLTKERVARAVREWVKTAADSPLYFYVASAPSYITLACNDAFIADWIQRYVQCPLYKIMVASPCIVEMKKAHFVEVVASTARVTKPIALTLPTQV